MHERHFDSTNWKQDMPTFLHNFFRFPRQAQASLNNGTTPHNPTKGTCQMINDRFLLLKVRKGILSGATRGFAPATRSLTTTTGDKHTNTRDIRALRQPNAHEPPIYHRHSIPASLEVLDSLPWGCRIRCTSSSSFTTDSNAPHAGSTFLFLAQHLS